MADWRGSATAISQRQLPAYADAMGIYVAMAPGSANIAWDSCAAGASRV